MTDADVQSRGTETRREGEALVIAWQRDGRDREDVLDGDRWLVDLIFTHSLHPPPHTHTCMCTYQHPCWALSILPPHNGWLLSPPLLQQAVLVHGREVSKLVADQEGSGLRRAEALLSGGRGRGERRGEMQAVHVQ